MQGLAPNCCGLTSFALESLLRETLESTACFAEVTLLAASGAARTLGLTLETGERLVLRLRPRGLRTVYGQEAYQLQKLARQEAILVPRVLGHGVISEGSPVEFLLIERLPGTSWRALRPELERTERRALSRRLGEILAAFHLASRGHRFGELAPGRSPRFESWPTFFGRLWQGRVEAVLRSDRLPGPVLDAVERIHASLPLLLQVDGEPALVHANLGFGGILCPPPAGEADQRWRLSGAEEVTLIHGHPELDLAYLEEERGLDPWFLEGYSAPRSLESGFVLRRDVYLLYRALDYVVRRGDCHRVLAVLDLVDRISREAGSLARA